MNKKSRTVISKFLAIFLSVLFITEFLPVQIMAQAYSNSTAQKSYTKDLIENPSASEENTADILYEVVEKRDEYTKVYKKSDGSYTALVSKSPIHHFDNGVWEEINNTLISENSSYTNISNAFNVLFPKTISDDSQITVEANGSELSFSVDNISSSNGSVENDVATFDTAVESAENALANTQSSVKYESVNEGTDIQYTVLPNAIKENVIVSSKGDLKGSYSFIITAGELSYTLKDDGSIDFSDGSEIKFSIPRPVMTDSKYNVSYDIGVAVSDNGDGTVTLTYTPSAAWTDSNDRVYPINIDPAIVIPDDGYSENAFVESDKPTENFYNTSVAIISNGKMTDENTNDIVDSNIYSEFYVKFDLDSIECLTKSVTPTNVQMVTSGGAFNVAAYELTSECDF